MSEENKDLGDKVGEAYDSTKESAKEFTDEARKQRMNLQKVLKKHLAV